MPFFRTIYTLKQRLLYGAVFPVGRIHESGKKEVKVGMVPLTITPKDPLGDFVIPVLSTLGSARLEVLASKVSTFTRGHNKSPI